MAKPGSEIDASIARLQDEVAALQDATTALAKGAIAQATLLQSHDERISTLESYHDDSGGGGPPPGVDRTPMQIGWAGPWSEWIMDEPFLRLEKPMSGWTARRDGSNETMGMAEMWAAGLINPDTLTPKDIPNGFDYLTPGLFRYGARFYPEYYAGDYIIEWQGNCILKFGFGHREQKVEAPGRVRGTFKVEDRGWMNVEIRRPEGGAFRLDDFALFRAEHEDLFRAGETWNPDCIANYRRYDIGRGMDVTYPMKSSVRHIGMMTTKRSVFWGRSVALDLRAPGLPVGPPMEALFDLARASRQALWYNVAGFIGAPESFDRFTFGRDENGNDNRPDGAQLRTAAAAAFDEIIASDAWDRYADELVNCLEATGYDQTKPFYLQHSNEEWNDAHPFWRTANYCRGIGDRLTGSPGWSVNRDRGAGYLAGRMLHAFDEALKRAQWLQNWTMVIGAQTAWEIPAKSQLYGVQRYFEDRGLDPAPYLARCGVVTTSYFANALGSKGVIPRPEYGGSEADNIKENEDWKLAWLDRIRSDPDGLRDDVLAWYFREGALEDATLAWVSDRREAHRKAAAEFGAQWIGDYEGGSHESHGIIGLLGDNPEFATWWYGFRNGWWNEEATRRWCEEMRQDAPEAIIANFGNIGCVDVERRIAAGERKLTEAPWIDGFHGEPTAFSKGIEPFLRPVQ